MTVRDLPALNALLNASATVLLLLGYRAIRARQIETHKKLMLGACAMSVLFLISYLIYHAQAGSVPFTGQGAIRVLYFFILITHVVLAAIVPVIAILLLRRAFRGDIARHRKLARWGFPVWLYVSVTGVIVYWMLYQL